MPILDIGWIGNAVSHHSGTVTLDFGVTPASEASVVVTGQTGILSTTRVRVWAAEAATAENDADEHDMAGIFLRLVPAAIVADVGFTINATSFVGLIAGTLIIQYVWSA